MQIWWTNFLLGKRLGELQEFSGDEKILQIQIWKPRFKQVLLQWQVQAQVRLR